MLFTTELCISACQIPYFPKDNLKGTPNVIKKKNFKSFTTKRDIAFLFGAFPMLTKVRKMGMLTKSTNAISQKPFTIGCWDFQGLLKMRKEGEICENS